MPVTLADGTYDRLRAAERNCRLLQESYRELSGSCQTWMERCEEFECNFHTAFGIEPTRESMQQISDVVEWAISVREEYRRGNRGELALAIRKLLTAVDELEGDELEGDEERLLEKFEHEEPHCNP